MEEIHLYESHCIFGFFKITFMTYFCFILYDILGFMIFLCFILHLSYFLDPFNILAYPLKDPGLMSSGMMTAS